MNVLLTILICFLGCACSLPASSIRQIGSLSSKLTASEHPTPASSSPVRKSLSSNHPNDNKRQYHSTSHKRHLRKKKQYILAGLGAGLGTGLAGYGYDYGSLTASNNPLGYTTPNDPAAYGYATGSPGTSALAGSLIPSAASNTQQRQNLLGSFGEPDGLSSYSNAGLGSYTSNAGLSSYGNGASTSYSSLSNGGIDANALSNTIGGGYESRLTSALTNSLSNSLSNELSNGQLNGISALSSYGAGGDASPYTNLKGLNPLVSSSFGSDAKDLGNLAGKYTAASLSAGLDTPNGISNIANLLNSASTSFDTDAQTQIIAGNNVNLNSLGQRFGNHLSGNHVTGGQSPFTSQSALAEAQAFGNQLSHLSNGKINLGSHTHASYGNFGDNIDSNSLNEIGQIASTGISDSSLQKLLGQLMAGQMGHAEHGGTSQGLGGLPSDASLLEQENSEQDVETPLEDQQGFVNHQLSPLLHGQTVHAHASDKPKNEQNEENHVSFAAMQKAMDVQQEANKEHQKRLENLKKKLKMLREKLHKLKSEYEGDNSEDEDFDSSEVSEKSEMETLDDLKKATEDAINELQKETLKIAKAKGLKGSKKLIFIHKYPQSNSNSEVTGKKKGEDVGDLGTDLLELIEDENQSGNGKSVSHDGTTAPQSLTDLEKQAEQEVNFLTSKSPKVIRKHHHLKGRTPAVHNTLNPGLHIHIPEPIDEGDNYSQIRKPKLTSPNASGKTFSRLRQRPRIKEEFNKNQRTGQLKSVHPPGLDGLEQLLPVQEHVNQNPTRHNHIRGNSYNRFAKKHRNHSLGFFSIGCWRDKPERALPSLEGIFPILDGNNFKRRRYAIRKCAQVARVQGFYGFAIENGGHCLGGKNALQTYAMYGPSRACRQDGKGGPWSMEVYKFTNEHSENDNQENAEEEPEVNDDEEEQANEVEANDEDGIVKRLYRRRCVMIRRTCLNKIRCKALSLRPWQSCCLPCRPIKPIKKCLYCRSRRCGLTGSTSINPKSRRGDIIRAVGLDDAREIFFKGAVEDKKH